MKKLLLTVACLSMVGSMFALAPIKPEEILTKIVDGSFDKDWKEIQAVSEAAKTTKDQTVKLASLIKAAKPAQELMMAVNFAAEKAAAGLKLIKLEKVGNFLKNGVNSMNKFIDELAKYSEFADLIVIMKSVPTAA